MWYNILFLSGPDLKHFLAAGKFPGSVADSNIVRDKGCPRLLPRVKDFST
jgi:hypothetical protein